MSPTPRRTLVITLSAVAAALVIVLVAVLLVLSTTQSRQGTAPTPTPAPTAQGEPEQWRPQTQITTSSHWMNDPQRPVFAGGLWHLYYLYNADYPTGNGTAWYHVTSTDLVHWKDEGVAIEKYENGLGDIWTGSVVVDEHNTAGFGKDALVALVTQQDAGVQRQSLYYSTDGGYSFTSYEGNPVMDNPGVDAWRDPKIVWDAARERWLMLLAEGTKVGFYTSPDLKSWTYQSGFTHEGLGILECPDLFEMTVDGDPDRTTWVLGVSANGHEQGMTTGYAYWTGAFDGTTFTPAATEPQWLDGGSDFYAGVTWSDPRDDQPLDRRYGIAWMNNWGYANELPTDAWQGGALSTVRDIRLSEVDGRATLSMRPLDALEKLEGATDAAKNIELASNDAVPAPVTAPQSGAFRIRATVAAGDTPATELRIKIGDKKHFATVGINFDDSTLFLARDADAIAAAMPDLYRTARTAALPSTDGTIELDIVVDALSLEVFTGDGAASLTSLAFVDGNEISLESIGGDAVVESISVTPLTATH